MSLNNVFLIKAMLAVTRTCVVPVPATFGVNLFDTQECPYMPQQLPLAVKVLRKIILANCNP